MSAAAPSYVSYAEFGQRFFEIAVTRERIAETVGGLTGRPIEVGPIGVGPMRLVKVRATGEVGAPSVEPLEGEPVAFAVAIPIELYLIIEMALDKYRFTANVVVHLAVTARAAAPLYVVIEIGRPTARAVDVDVHADGLRASVIQLVAGIDTEIKKAVASFVQAEIDKPEAQAARTIDVARALANLGRN